MTRKQPPRTPGTPAPLQRPPTAIELWYLDCLRILTKHYKRPPSLPELATYCKRSTWPTYAAMISLEAKGVVRRNDDRRFVEVSR